MRFLLIGECMAELAPLDTSGEFKIGFAGDTLNTAWYMAQIVPDVEYLTAVGDENISLDMRAFMRSSGVSDVHVSEIAGAIVGLYLIHLANGECSFSYWRGQSAARQLAMNPNDLEKAIEHADLIYFSGITLAILESSSRDKHLSSLGSARRAGKIVAFDTNLWPRLWESATEMCSAIMRAAAQSDIVLPSYDDEAATWA
jgi:2-dehydro-3-deoxygluconokinase